MKKKGSISFQKQIPKFLQKYSNEIENKNFIKQAEKDEKRYQKQLIEQEKFENSEKFDKYKDYIINEEDMEALKHATVVEEEIQMSSSNKRKLDNITKFNNIMSNKKQYSTVVSKDKDKDKDKIELQKQKDILENNLNINDDKTIKKKKKKKKAMKKNKKLLSFTTDDE